MILSVCVIRYRSALYKIILGSKKFVVSQRNGGRKRGWNMMGLLPEFSPD